MDPDDRLAGRLADEHTVVLCVAESGVELVDPPAVADGWAAQMVVPPHPLAVLDKSSQPDAIAAFVTAMTDGYGSTGIVLADGDERLLEVYDARSTWECLLCVISEATGVSVERLEAAPLPIRRLIAKLDQLGRTIFVDDAYVTHLGFSREEILDLPALNRIHPEDQGRVIENYADLLRRGPGAQTRVRQRLRRKDGSYIWFEITHTNHFDADEPHLFSELLDISDEMSAQMALEQRESLLAGLTEALPIAVLQLDPDGRPVLWNEQWSLMTGCDPEGGIELLASVTTASDTLARAAADLLDGGSPIEVAIELSVDGPWHGILRARGLGGDENRTGYLFTIEDVSELVTTQQELRRAVMIDSLTGALSRVGIEDLIADAIRSRAERGSPLSLLYVDLDGFKEINDTLGHRAGDRVLRETVQVIRGVLRSADQVGRIGGDEFIVLLFDVNGSQAAAVAERIIDLLKQLAITESSTLQISASIGLAQAEPGDDFDSLVGRADTAMYRIKRRSKQL